MTMGKGRRNDFVHGNPESIDDELVQATVENLQNGPAGLDRRIQHAMHLEV
jgi:hypothetical protein